MSDFTEFALDTNREASAVALRSVDGLAVSLLPAGSVDRVIVGSLEREAGGRAFNEKLERWRPPPRASSGSTDPTTSPLRPYRRKHRQQNQQQQQRRQQQRGQHQRGQHQHQNATQQRQHPLTMNITAGLLDAQVLPPVIGSGGDSAYLRRSASAEATTAGSRLGTAASSTNRWYPPSSRASTAMATGPLRSKPSVHEPSEAQMRGAEQRAQALENRRFRNQKEKLAAKNTHSKKKKSYDWRKDDDLGTHDTPSMEHSLLRASIDERWLRQYEEEQKMFVSEALHSELRLREVFVETAQLGLPNVQRTAVCVELLWRLSKKFGRFKDLHALLVVELARSVYHRFDVFLAHLESKDRQDGAEQWPVKELVALTPFYELIDGLQATVRKLRHSLCKLNNLRDEVEVEAEKRNKVFTMAIETWQWQLRRRVFQNWRQASMLQKRTRQRLHQRRLRIWFDAFKKRFQETKKRQIRQLYEETEAERARQEERADSLLADKTGLEQDVKDLKKTISKLHMEITHRDSINTDLRRQLAESKDRETRLRESCEALMDVQLMQVRQQIGRVPTLTKDPVTEEDIMCRPQSRSSRKSSRPNSRATSSRPNSRMSSRPSSRASRRSNGSGASEDEDEEDPFWAELQDISQMSRAALEQCEIEQGAAHGTVARMQYGNLKLWEAGEVAMNKLMELDATPLVKTWVNHQLAIADGSGAAIPDVNKLAMDVMSEEALSQGKRLRIDNFGTHLRDSAEYTSLMDRILLSQLPKDYQGTYELVLTPEQLQLDDDAKKAKERKEKRAAEAQQRKVASRDDAVEGDASQSGNGAEEGETAGEAKEGGSEQEEDPEVVAALKAAAEAEAMAAAAAAEAAADAAAAAALEDVHITRNTMKRLVMSEFDSNSRAVRLLACAQEWLGVTKEMISPTEIADGNPEWNFGLLSNLFVSHPSLRTDPVPFITDYNDLQKLTRNWDSLLNQIDALESRANAGGANESMTDPTVLIHQMVKQAEKVSLRVNDRIRILQRSHSTWWKAAKIVLRRLVTDLAKRARGIEGSIANEELEKERGAFMKLSFRKLEVILRCEPDPEKEFSTVKDYVGDSFNDLRKIYKAYGAMGGGGGSVSFYEFGALVRDCNLTTKDFSNRDVELVFVKTNIEIDEETGERIELAVNPDNALTTTEFVEMLIRISHGLYANVPLVDSETGQESRRTLTQCMTTLMEEHILPYAKRSDAEEFRKKLRAKPVHRIFQKYGPRIEKIFERYAKADSSDMMEERASMTMNLKEFFQMMKEKHLLGPTLPHKTVMSLFQNVQVRRPAICCSLLLYAFVLFGFFVSHLFFSLYSFIHFVL